MTECQIERLASAGFQLLPALQIQTHYVIERDGFVALVERSGEGAGQIGAPGLLRGDALCALVHKPAGAFFVAKGAEWPATPEQVDALRRFDADLRRALAS